MTGFTKLFGTILTSTVWQEPGPTRLTWIAMLAEADQKGQVLASLPGLAHIARVTLPECEAAIATFLAPDPYSRTEEHEGRRIERIDGGWRLLNHAKYRAMLSEESIRASKRDYMRRVRAEAKAPEPVEKVEKSGKGGQLSIQAEAEAEATRSKSLVRQAGRFSEFWDAYPLKSGKKPCLAKWKARGLDKDADTILADIANRVKNDKRWLDGFVPNPLTYLNQDRWEDEVVKGEKPAATGGKFEGRKDHIRSESKLESEQNFIRHMLHLGRITQEQCDKQLQEAADKHRASING